MLLLVKLASGFAPGAVAADFDVVADEVVEVVKGFRKAWRRFCVVPVPIAHGPWPAAAAASGMAVRSVELADRGSRRSVAMEW